MTMVSNSTSSSSSSKRRLVFDRRYGWVLDEWKSPSEEALSGARGMFCILPLAKAVVKLVSQSVNLAAQSTVKVLERPSEFSPQALSAGLNDQFQNFIHSIQENKFNLFNPNQNLSVMSTSGLQHKHMESDDSENS